MFYEQREEEFINSIRAVTGIDKEIITAVFKGMYIAELQRLTIGRTGIVLPLLGTLSIEKNKLNDDKLFNFTPSEDFNYAIDQAFKGKLYGLEDLLKDIINSNDLRSNEEILDMLLTKEEMMDLGLMD